MPVTVSKEYACVDVQCAHRREEREREERESAVEEK